MTIIIPFDELSPSRQKAFLAISAMRRRAEEAMQTAQADHGTHSPQWDEAATRYEQATEMFNEQMYRTRMPEHPLYVSEQSDREYYAALSCPICGDPSCLGNECSPPHEEEDGIYNDEAIA